MSAGLALMCSFSLAAMPGGDDDAERIRSHLELVERLLRAQPAPSPSTAAARRANLDALHRYWQVGSFPQNTTVPGGRHPIFIDHRGVACAAGQLIIDSGEAVLARRISEQMNEAYLDEMHDESLTAWVTASGLTMGELRLIQPTYAYRARYPEPLLEAAHLGDTAKVKALLAEASYPGATEALRAALGSAEEGRFAAQNRVATQQGPRVFHETRWVSDGLETIDFLLANGADLSDVSDGQPSPLYLVLHQPKLRARLEKAGAKLTAAERVLAALRTGRCDSVAALVSDPKVDFTAQQLGGSEWLSRDPSAAAATHACEGELHAGQHPGAYEPAAWFKEARGSPDRFVTLLKRGVPITDLASLRAAFDLSRAVKPGSDHARVIDSVLRSTRLPSSEPPYSPGVLPACQPEAVEALRARDHGLIDFYASHVWLNRCKEFSLGQYLFDVKRRKRPLTKPELEHVAAALHGHPIASVTEVENAVENRDLALVELLLRSGVSADRDPSYPEQCPVIARAAAMNQVAMVKLLKRYNTSIVGSFTASRKCPGTLHPERARPADRPPQPPPGQEVRGLLYTSSSNAVPFRGAALQITIADMELSAEMRSVLGL